MSEEFTPEVNDTNSVTTPDVLETTPQETPETTDATEVNYAEKSLGELSVMFEDLMSDENRVKRAKEAEAIKSAFYKKLTKEAEAAEGNVLESLENGFKSLYNTFKKERSEYNRRMEAERAENLVKKQAVVEDLKQLLDKQEEVSASFPEFRAIQARWREIGPVPASAFRNLNDTYQFYVEQFYDKVQINRDMRDLDFKKNLEAKEAFCAEAEKLTEDENVVDAFKELQKLHEQWKEFGPVAKEYREQIWQRFKEATAKINKNYQAFFEGQKEKQIENLEAKRALCEKVEEIIAREVIEGNEWSNLTKAIEEIQKEWKKIGYATKKENQKIYERFRAANDKFFERKRLYYAEYKDAMAANVELKMAIIEKAEALSGSSDWKKTTEDFIELQRQWKEIGAVPRKKADALWKRFRAACDAFFDRKQENAKSESGFRENLKAKKALIEEIKAMEPSDDKTVMADLQKSYLEKWSAIGFVPFREKDAVNQAFREAMSEKFPEFGSRGAGRQQSGRPQRTPLSEKDKLIQQYNRLQQDLDTYENNIGFFAASKNSEPLIRQMQERIDSVKEELSSLEARIREMENEA